MYPRVEWGLLLSRLSKGNRGFPSRAWIQSLSPKLNLSGHICGEWVRELISGNFTLKTERPEYLSIFKRFQLNFFGMNLTATPEFYSAINGLNIIFQLDGVNDHLFKLGYTALFDRSGGQGRTPRNWIKPLEGVYCGYAGGLGPDNLKTELDKIAAVADNTPIWIDMQYKLRTNDVLDMNKVKTCLEIACGKST